MLNTVQFVNYSYKFQMVSAYFIKLNHFYYETEISQLEASVEVKLGNTAVAVVYYVGTACRVASVLLIHANGALSPCLFSPPLLFNRMSS